MSKVAVAVDLDATPADVPRVRGSFLPGAFIEGTVHVTVRKKALTFFSLRVVVRGVSLGGFRKNDVREAVLFSEEIVLEGAATELGTSSSAAAKKKKKKKSKLPNSSLTTLEVGEYAWAFSKNLPPDLPESCFFGPRALTRYTVEALISNDEDVVKWQSDAFEFGVSNPYPDNYIGSQRLFADVRSDKGVTMNAGVDRGGYAPGDDAVVTFAIQNGGKKKIKEMKHYLVHQCDVVDGSEVVNVFSRPFDEGTYDMEVLPGDSTAGTFLVRVLPSLRYPTVVHETSLVRNQYLLRIELPKRGVELEIPIIVRLTNDVPSDDMAPYPPVDTTNDIGKRLVSKESIKAHSKIGSRKGRFSIGRRSSRGSSAASLSASMSNLDEVPEDATVTASTATTATATENTDSDDILSSLGSGYGSPFASTGTAVPATTSTADRPRSAGPSGRAPPAEAPPEPPIRAAVPPPPPLDFGNSDYVALMNAGLAAAREETAVAVASGNVLPPPPTLNFESSNRLHDLGLESFAHRVGPNDGGGSPSAGASGSAVVPPPPAFDFPN